MAEVPDDVRSSAFARSETVLQLAWVVGGAIGISISVVISGAYGLGIAAVGLIVMLVVTLRARLPSVAPSHSKKVLTLTGSSSTTL